jgi:copper(I)-binding protein
LHRQELKKMTRVALTVAAALTVMGAPALAHDYTVGALKIVQPWARATPKGATIGGGYLKITNTGSIPDRLVGGSSDVSKRFEIHEMSMDHGVMKMRELAKGLAITPGQTVEFSPSGYHVMFVGLNQPLKQGDQIKATLQFEKAGKVDVDFTVEGIGAQSAGGSDHGTNVMPGMSSGSSSGGMQMKK